MEKVSIAVSVAIDFIADGVFNFNFGLMRSLRTGTCFLCSFQQWELSIIFTGFFIIVVQVNDRWELPTNVSSCSTNINFEKWVCPKNGFRGGVSSIEVWIPFLRRMQHRILVDIHQNYFFNQFKLSLHTLNECWFLIPLIYLLVLESLHRIEEELSYCGSYCSRWLQLNIKQFIEVYMNVFLFELSTTRFCVVFWVEYVHIQFWKIVEEDHIKLSMVLFE